MVIPTNVIVVVLGITNNAQRMNCRSRPSSEHDGTMRCTRRTRACRGLKAVASCKYAAYIHGYACTYVHTDMNYMHTCMPTYMYACIHTYIPSYILTNCVPTYRQADVVPQSGHISHT